MMKNDLRLWCCGKELWGLGWATDVVCTMYPGSDDGSGTGKKGRKREERHRRDTSASPPRVLAESVEWRKAHCLSAASYQIRCLSSYSSCPSYHSYEYKIRQPLPTDHFDRVSSTPYYLLQHSYSFIVHTLPIAVECPSLLASVCFGQQITTTYVVVWCARFSQNCHQFSPQTTAVADRMYGLHSP